MSITRYSLAVTAGCMLSGAVASGAIIPSWRINSIPSPAPSPALEGAYSVSLMVELTGGSQFGVAGLDLGAAFPSFPFTFFNQLPLGSDTKPNPSLVAMNPELAFDTYVGTTTDQAPAILGKLNGLGAAQVGTAGRFNVAWAATPNTGGTGQLEIARITLLNAGGPTNLFLAIPPDAGLVRDTLNPATDVPLPPFPAPGAMVPEPMAVGVAALPLWLTRRSRRQLS